jgi:hypothetical protein
MRNPIAIGAVTLLVATAFALPATASGNTVSGVARGYSVASELEPGRNGRFSASIELRALDSNALIARLHAQLSPGEATSFPLASHPGLEIRALAQGVGANSVRYVVEVFRLGILETRHEATVSVAPLAPSAN